MMRCAPGVAAVVRVTGEDAAAFLQGQCSADLRAPSPVDALWLNRKGRVLAHTVVAKEPDGSFLLLCPHLAAADLIAVVTANVIADDVVAADETARWGRLVVWAGAAPVAPGGRVFPTRRFGVAAWDVLVPVGSPMAGEPTDPSVLEAVRIAAGVPAVPADCGANEFPQECGLEPWVSYTKGCYLGQEVMARIQSMGALRRVLRRVASAAGTPLASDLELTLAGKPVGRTRSVAGAQGLALVAVDLPEGTRCESSAGAVVLGAPAALPA